MILDCYCIVSAYVTCMVAPSLLLHVSILNTFADLSPKCICESELLPKQMVSALRPADLFSLSRENKVGLEVFMPVDDLGLSKAPGPNYEAPEGFFLDPPFPFFGRAGVP